MSKKLEDWQKEGWEVVDEAKVRDTVELLVDYLEEQKIHPRIVVVAMTHIVEKIKSYYEMEIKELETHPESGTVH